MSTVLKSLDEFSAHLADGREIGVIIAESKSAKAKYKQHLHSQHFCVVTRPATLAAALNHHHKVMIDPAGMTEAEQKQLYDVVCQYPTGSIQIGDPLTFKTYSITRSLRDHQTVLLLTQTELNNLQKNFPLLDKLGMVWREALAESPTGAVS